MRAGDFRRTNNAVVHAVFDGFNGDTNGVADCFDAGATVGDDTDAVYTKKKGAAVLFVAGFFLNRLEGSASEPSTRHPDGGFLNFMFEPRENGGGNALTGFENNISNKSVADHNLHRAFEKIPPFNIADEVNRSGGEEFESLLGQGVTFGIFRTDREGAHLGFFVNENFIRVDGAH